MKQSNFARAASLLALAFAAPLAFAKLPPPAAPATPEAQLKAQEAAARTACHARSQDQGGRGGGQDRLERQGRQLPALPGADPGRGPCP